MRLSVLTFMSRSCFQIHSPASPCPQSEAGPAQEEVHLGPSSPGAAPAEGPPQRGGRRHHRELELRRRREEGGRRRRRRLEEARGGGGRRFPDARGGGPPAGQSRTGARSAIPSGPPRRSSAGPGPAPHGDPGAPGGGGRQIQTLGSPLELRGGRQEPSSSSSSSSSVQPGGLPSDSRSAPAVAGRRLRPPHGRQPRADHLRRRRRRRVTTPLHAARGFYPSIFCRLHLR